MQLMDLCEDTLIILFQYQDRLLIIIRSVIGIEVRTDVSLIDRQVYEI